MVALVGHGAFYPDCLSDDAFISFRYARNLVSGHGLVFNPGETPVEGYTNFLWTLLMAGGMALKIDPERFARWLGCGLGAGAQVAAYLLARRVLPHRPLLAALPPFLLAASSFFVVESIQGLETTLLACLLAWGVWAWSMENDIAPGGGGRLPWSGLLFGLAALTRPEGILIFLVLGGLSLAAAGRRALNRQALHRWILFALPVALHLGFRRWFYGEWVPNTFFAKTGGGLAQLMRGSLYVKQGLISIFPWVVLAMVALAALRSRRGEISRRMLYGLTAVWLTSWAGVAAVGGDFKPTERFLVWTFPLLAVLAAAGWGAVLDRCGKAAAPLAWLGAGVLIILTFTASAQGRHFARLRPADLDRLRQAAAWLDRHLPLDAVLATGPAGALPYYTGRSTIDMWGINDKVIGRRSVQGMGRGTAGHEKGDGAYVFSRQPDVILFTAARFSDIPFPEDLIPESATFLSERELLALPGFHTAYRWRSVLLRTTTLNFYQKRASRETAP
ncbi:MAG: glycosyltransferase family 39 protein [Acidobacteriota bacterium]